MSGRLRRLLDRLYRASGILAACQVLLIFATVAGQVMFTVTDSLIASFAGAPLGLMIPSYSDFAGFFLASATFLALAHTFREGGHIRVTLVIGTLPEPLRRVVEVLCLGTATALSAFLAWHAIALTLESWRFGDASYGLVAIPIWIPQLSLCLGAVMLALCTADGLVTTVAGRPFGNPGGDDQGTHPASAS